MVVLRYAMKCHMCGNQIDAGVDAKKDKSGYRHPGCQSEPLCMICDDSVGCINCEFFSICNRKEIKRCICKSCSENSLGYQLYVKAVDKTYPALEKSPEIPKTAAKVDDGTKLDFINFFQTDYGAIAEKYTNDKNKDDSDTEQKEEKKNDDSKHVQASLFDAF